MSARARTILIGVAMGFVVLLAWFFLFWSPAGKDLNKAKTDRAAAIQHRDELQGRLARLKKLDPEKIQAARDQFAALVPDKDAIDDFILEVNDRATKTNINFVSVSPQQPSAAPAAPGAAAAGVPTPIALQLSINGDYLSILHFLEAMRDGPRLFTVDTMSLSKGGETPNAITASVGARVFISKIPTPAAPAALAP